MLAIIRQSSGRLLHNRRARVSEPLAVRVIRPAIVDSKKRKADDSRIPRSYYNPHSKQQKRISHVCTGFKMQALLLTEHAQEEA